MIAKWEWCQDIVKLGKTELNNGGVGPVKQNKSKQETYDVVHIYQWSLII